jgi:serine/threonine-protein kinase RsbW
MSSAMSPPLSVKQAEWRRELPGTLEAIDAICVEFQLWRAGACADLNSFSVELLLREALTNAVLHGCAGNPHRRILCSLRLKPRRLVIAIHDGGDGFDWHAAWHRWPDPSETHGRGVAILRQYASLVRFNRKGNSVTLVKRF